MIETLAFVVSWLAGLLLQEDVRLPPAALLIGAGGGVLGLLLGRRWPAARRAFLVILGLSLGAGRLWLAQPRFDATSLSTYNDRGPVTVRGVVAERPDILGSDQTLRVSASHIAGDGFDLDVNGVVQVWLPAGPRYRYGDELILAGELQTPARRPASDYHATLARQGVYSVMYRPAVRWVAGGRGAWLSTQLYAFKDHLLRIIADILPAPQSGLLAAMLLGDASGIPSRLMNAFRATGTSHIIVISGWNIAMLAGLVTAVCRPLWGRRPALWLSLIAVVVYAALVGFEPPTLRAAIMGGLSLLALLAGRQTLALNSLALATVLMTAFRPYVLWDLGFQLSCGATLGLILYHPPLHAGTQALLRRLGLAGRSRLARLLDDVVLTTLAAQVLVLPVLIYRLRQLPLLMLPANLLILPSQGALLGLGALATLGGLVWLPLGRLLGWLAWPLLTGMVAVVEWLARWPAANISLPALSPAALLLYYGLMALLAVYLSWPADRRRQVWLRARRAMPAGVSLAMPALAVILTWAAALSQPDGQLHVYVLDVGQGDAIFIQTPSGRQVLLDGGPDGPTLLAELGRHMPFWDRRLDVILASHDDADHVTGLFAALERYRVDVALDPGFVANSDISKSWARSVADAGARRVTATAGTALVFSDGVRIDVLHPPADAGDSLQGNEGSLVARLTYGQVSILLAGDLERAGEQALLASGRPLASAVLKVAHHGSAGGSSAELLDAVRPALAVISVGAGNRFGHPAVATLHRFEDRGIPVWRTDQRGSIELISNGARLWARSRR